MNQKAKNFITKVTLSLLGLIMFLYYIWLRFVRERLPKDIPFDLSIVGFLILLYICIIYAYVVINLIFKNKNQSRLISTIIYYIYKPLKTLDETIKTNRVIKPYYEKILIYLIHFIKNNIQLHPDYSYLKLYIPAQIIPRIILLLALYIDTFYFHQLYLLYKIILIGIVLLISKYVKYSFKYAREQYTSQLESNIYRIGTSYNPDDPEHDPKHTSFVSVETFILAQAFRLGDGLEGYSYYILPTSEFMKEYCERNNIPKNKRLSKEQINDRDKEFYRILDIVIPLSVHLEEYDLAETYDRSIYAKIIIFSLYFICWSYILVVSIHTLTLSSFTLNIIQEISLTLIPLINHIYYYYLCKINTIDNEKEDTEINRDLEDDLEEKKYNKERYKVGMLRIDETTDIPTVIQMDLVVIYLATKWPHSMENVEMTVIGYLTNNITKQQEDLIIEKEAYFGTRTKHKVNFKLTDTPYIEDIDKGLYFNSIIHPLVVKPEDFEINENATRYIQNPSIIKKLDDSLELNLEYESIAYNPIGTINKNKKK